MAVIEIKYDKDGKPIAARDVTDGKRIQFYPRKDNDKMNETTFENAKQGDRVWSLVFGWGTIIQYDASNNTFPIHIRFDKYGNGVYTYSATGLWDNCQQRSLFWDEIKITPPPRPKQKVKKVVEGWVNVYPKNYNIFHDYFYVSNTLYKTKEDAIKIRNKHAMGDPCFIHHEYEVEE